MDRADDVSFAISIKRRRSKADFAPTWSEWRDLNSRPHGPEPCALPSMTAPRSLLSAVKSCEKQ